MNTQTITRDILYNLLGVNEAINVPGTMMKKLLDKPIREQMFKDFLEINNDIWSEQFQTYFEEEQAERKTNMQDFTPREVNYLTAKIVSPKIGVSTLFKRDFVVDDNYFESACGTGGMLIAHWSNELFKESPFTYKPSEHWHSVEELSARALPFLLFNMAIRGMNGVIFFGDSLSRECKNVFFLQNQGNDFMCFSDINVMPRSAAVVKEFNVKKWIGDEINHIETPLDEELKDLLNNQHKPLLAANGMPMIEVEEQMSLF